MSTRVRTLVAVGLTVWAIEGSVAGGEAQPGHVSKPDGAAARTQATGARPDEHHARKPPGLNVRRLHSAAAPVPTVGRNAATVRSRHAQVPPGRLHEHLAQKTEKRD
jgi:hypothetical protein